MEVVFTRDSDDGQPYARALGPRVTVLFMPVTSIAAATPGETARLVEAAAALDRYDRVFIASRHAVPPLVEALIRCARTPATLPPVAAVGPATTAALVTAGFAAESLGDSGEQAAAALVARGVAGHRILAPRAAGGRDEPLELLRRAGATVDAIDAYRTLATSADAPELAAGKVALATARAGACMIFAPSQADALAGVLAADGGLAGLARVPILTIGPTTAAAVRALGLAVAAVAPTPTPAGMAQAFATVYPTP